MGRPCKVVKGGYIEQEGLLWTNAMGRRIEEPAPFDKSCRIGKPYGVLEGGDFPRRLIAGTGSAVELLKRRGVQEQCFHDSPLMYHSTVFCSP